MDKYIGFWFANGTRGQIVGSSKRGIRAKLRLILRGNLTPGSVGQYRVERYDDCEVVENSEVRVSK
jgi:hypothetical protein